MSRVVEQARIGVLYAAAAFLIWGLMPVYWKALQHVPALEILAHRIVWGLLFAAAWMSVRGRWPELRAVFRNRRTVAALAASTVFIAVNWGLFVWAVVTGRVLSTSLGYFINPLMVVLLGLFVLRERLNRRQWLAVGLAALAVTILTVRLGRLPWVSLALATSFALYGLLRKTVNADAVVGLTFEVTALAPLAAGYLVLREHNGTAALGHHGWTTDLMLVTAGAVTVVPLLFFTLGVRRVQLSTAGLLQFIAPTLTFVLAVFLYGEPFTLAHGVSFSLIWIALAIYVLDLRYRLRRLDRLGEAPSPREPASGRLTK